MALTDRPIFYKAAVGAVLVAALALTACGRKGPLEAPPGAAVTDSAGGEAAKEPAKKPDRRFFLDPLI